MWYKLEFNFEINMDHTQTVLCMGFVGMCSFRTQLPYNSPGGGGVIRSTSYFSHLSFFPLKAQSGFSEDPGMWCEHGKRCQRRGMGVKSHKFMPQRAQRLKLSVSKETTI